MEPRYKPETKKVLSELLKHESPGNLLQALGDIFVDDSLLASGEGVSMDDTSDMRDVGGALRVMALGVDARSPP